MVLSADGSQAAGMLVGPEGSPVEVSVGRDALRMVSMTGPDGSTSTATYDADGMQTGLLDPNGHTQGWTYDERKAFEEPVPTRIITTDRRGADNHRRSAWQDERERSGGGW